MPRDRFGRVIPGSYGPGAGMAPTGPIPGGPGRLGFVPTPWNAPRIPGAAAPPIPTRPPVAGVGGTGTIQQLSDRLGLPPEMIRVFAQQLGLMRPPVGPGMGTPPGVGLGVGGVPPGVGIPPGAGPAAGPAFPPRRLPVPY